jgi:PAS domain S-box-containing protein
LDKAEYIEKSAYVNRQFMEDKRFKYGENSNCQIFIISGRIDNIGTVLNLNTEVLKGFCLSKEDIKGTKINYFMPKVYADHHDKWITNYFNSNTEKVINTERHVYPINNKGYIIPGSLLIKVIPQVKAGIKIIGLLRPHELSGNPQSAPTNFGIGPKDNINNTTGNNFHYILYNITNGTIYGISENCFDNYGIRSDLIYGNNKHSTD